MASGSQLKEPKEDFSCLYEVSLPSWLDGMTQVVNGLICVCEDNKILSLHNICTGQRMRLPGPLSCNSISTFDLGPSTELSSRRKLDYDASGLADLLWENAPCIDPQQMKQNTHIPDAKTFAMDGFLYWYLWPQFMFSFDLNKEKFQWIKIPKDLFDNGLRLFVLEDWEGKRWSKICVPVPEWLHDLRTIATGNLVTGEIPHPVARGIHHSRHRHFCLAWISCLQDNRFTPLDDVLSGAAAHES
ncbi:OLC1v1022490C1 [Oldenlandia corymbosa var. corymbosa]|uniref:OLC1v1022490C1 n=1 Tax=Oldenlandia corymbosa var. corymbosa TaxID=529605 RepID=A0AAV1C0B3_OLDCO|nr:OLC1v1022490C1 [Oldenlandia corymbosa var. corymbosa]